MDGSETSCFSELLAWRSKSESWESTKASSVKSLQAERDRLQVEWQLMRESLQSAEATLAVQTAAVQVRPWLVPTCFWLLCLSSTHARRFFNCLSSLTASETRGRAYGGEAEE